MTGTSETPTTEAGLLSPEELSAILTEPRLTSSTGVKVSFSMVPEVGLLAGHIHAQERAVVSLTAQNEKLRDALEAVRTASAWRDDLDPQERLRMCLVASRAALEGQSK